MSLNRILVILLLALLAAGAITASFYYDHSVREQILAAQGKGWKKSADAQMMGAVSKYGDWPQLMIAGAIGLLIAWRTGRPDWTRIIVAAMVASTLAGMLANTSRLTTGRVRPRDTPKIEAGWYGPFHNGQLTIGNSKYNAFPSGHTATAVGFAAVFLFAKPLIGLLVLLAALAIAWSRMALGAHNLSDIIVSVVLSLVVGWFVWRTAVTRGDEIVQWIRARIPQRSRA